jgi:hypothetical protein
MEECLAGKSIEEKKLNNTDEYHYNATPTEPPIFFNKMKAQTTSIINK